MNAKIHPAVFVILIIAAIGVVLLVMFKAAGPREDGAKAPVDMGKMMGGGMGAGMPAGKGAAASSGKGAAAYSGKTK